MKDKKKITCLLIDMPVSNKRNISLRTTEKKLSKYKDLKPEIEKMLCMKTRYSWSGQETNGKIQIPTNIKIQEVQKVLLLGIAHILRRTL